MFDAAACAWVQVEIVGLKEANTTILERLAIHDKPARFWQGDIEFRRISPGEADPHRTHRRHPERRRLMQPSRTSIFRRQIVRTATAGSAAAALLLGLGTVAAAHDFWLVPDAFRVSPGSWTDVRGQTSSRFPTSESAVAPDRVADARVITASASTPITQLSQLGRSLRLRYRPVAPGQHLIAVRLLPRLVRESPSSFRRYMDLEGAPELRARYEREGLLPTIGSDSITRSYAKYAKTLVEVGSGGPRAYARPAGHPLEFVPLADPAAVRPGERLAVRLVFRGRPVAGAHVHAGAVPEVPGSRTDTAAAAAAAHHDMSVATDTEGVVHVAIDRDGLWNVRTIHIVPADSGAPADWDVHWATLVFSVDGTLTAGAARDAGSTADSAAVAAVVERYGKALAAGDSAAALSLLAPDAVILESGGVETREQYRNHHLPGDIAFARAVRSEDSPIHVVVNGDAAWAWSTSVTQGTYRERQVNSAGAELMVLSRSGGRWLIRAIHWSSRARR